MASCGKKKEKVVAVQPAVSKVVDLPSQLPMSLKAFISEKISSGAVVGDSIVLHLPRNVRSDASYVVIGPFHADWTVASLKPFILKYAFKAVIKKTGSAQNIIAYPEELYGGFVKGDYWYPAYDPDEVLTVLDPAPKYWAKTDNGEVFLFDEQLQLLPARPEWKE